MPSFRICHDVLYLFFTPVRPAQGRKTNRLPTKAAAKRPPIHEGRKAYRGMGRRQVLFARGERTDGTGDRANGRTNGIGDRAPGIGQWVQAHGPAPLTPPTTFYMSCQRTTTIAKRSRPFFALTRRPMPDARSPVSDAIRSAVRSRSGEANCKPVVILPTADPKELNLLSDTSSISQEKDFQ